MKVLKRPTQIGVVALILWGLLSADSMAQLRADIGTPVAFVIVAQDTLSTDPELLLIDLLDTSLHSLAEQSRRGRRIGGYTLLGLGIGSGLGGAATLAFGEGDDAQVVGYSLLGGGALLSGLSLLPFKLRGESERIYTAFSQAPADTPDQIHYKYFYWDRRFEEFSQKRRKDRIVGGITSIVVGTVAGVLAAQGSDQEGVHAFVWPALGPVLGGITSLLVESDAERRYDTYRRAKDDVLRQTSTTAVDSTASW